MGYTKTRVQKGMYVDEHERADVVEYREKFLKKMEELKL
jgi:hypothetical protein